jgi:hypothetical protein
VNFSPFRGPRHHPIRDYPFKVASARVVRDATASDTLVLVGATGGERFYPDNWWEHVPGAYWRHPGVEPR